MKTVYCVEKIVDGEKRYYFYKKEPKRLKVQCTYDSTEFTELICMFDAYGCYIESTANKLLSRKYYITYINGRMTMVKHEPRKLDKELSKEMGRLFLPR